MIRSQFKQWRKSKTIRRRIRRIKSRDARCHRCGLLGFYRLPEQHDRTLVELEELTAGYRTSFEGALTNSRLAGRIKRNEYDPRVGQHIGIADWLYGGVKCGIGDFRGGFTTWAVPGPRESTAGFLSMNQSGALVRVQDASAPGPLGAIKGVAQTFVWNVVRPHDCPYFIKHRPGLTPYEHVQRRENAQRRLRVSIRNGLLSIGASLIAGVILWAVLD